MAPGAFRGVHSAVMTEGAIDEHRNGLLVVVSGPSGVGKTTIVRALRDRLNGVLSISATTRPRSAQEIDGVDYFFIDEPRFKAMIEAGEFIEHAEVFGQYHYGTPRGPVRRALEEGRLVILEIDVQGALQVRRNFPAAYLVFIEPPDDEELLRRLRSRGRDDEAAIQRRFAEAARERRLARESGAYDTFVVNETLQQASDDTVELVRRAMRSTSTGSPS